MGDKPAIDIQRIRELCVQLDDAFNKGASGRATGIALDLATECRKHLVLILDDFQQFTDDMEPAMRDYNVWVDRAGAAEAERDRFDVLLRRTLALGLLKQGEPTIEQQHRACKLEAEIRQALTQENGDE